MTDSILTLKEIIAEQEKKITSYKRNFTRIENRNLRAMQHIRRLEYILSIMPGNVYWKKRNGKYQFCNINAARTIGIKSYKEIVDKTLHEFIDKKYADVINAYDEEIMNSDQEKTIEEDAFDANGNPAIYLTRKIPLHDDSGNVSGLLGISLDITELKNKEKEAKEAREKAETANKLKTNFIRNMQHDIRTPLAGIWSIANMLEKNETNAQKQEDLNDLKLCAKEFLDYCNSILDFSNMEESYLPIINKKFDITALINKILLLEQPAAKNKKLKLFAKIDKNVPNIIIGDEFRLYRILINLISNAIKFTLKGHVKLGIKALQKNRDRNIILNIIIEDTGVGITTEQQNYIYEKFTRLNPSNSTHFKGLGLGLGIVKQFMSDIEGDIEVKSALEQGTTFICTIPFKLPLEDQTNARSN